MVIDRRFCRKNGRTWPSSGNFGNCLMSGVHHGGFDPLYNGGLCAVRTERETPAVYKGQRQGLTESVGGSS